MYIYSVGKRLCGTHVRITDLTKGQAPRLVNCFHSLPGRRFSALAFHIYADLIFFADVTHQLIHRMRMETEVDEVHVVAANTGKVGGEGRLYSVSQKNPPLRTCGNFSKTFGNFSTKFYVPIIRYYLC